MQKATIRDIIFLMLWLAAAVAACVFFALNWSEWPFALAMVIIMAFLFLSSLIWAVLARNKEWLDTILWTLSGISLAGLFLWAANFVGELLNYLLYH